MTALQRCRAILNDELAHLLAEAREGRDTTHSEVILARWIDLLAELSDKDGEARGRREMIADMERRLADSRVGRGGHA